jgi:outer membrane protein
MGVLIWDFLMQKSQRFLAKVVIAAAALVSLSARADDLMQVYNQALAADPVFAQAQSTWKSQKMNLPIAEAGYLPQVTVNANSSRNYIQTFPGLSTNVASGVSATSYTWQYGYSVNVTQPIFNLAAWESIKNADATVKAATASYLAAQQSLIQRTATAYFNVLQAYERLRYTVANKRAVWQQFLTAREQFRVGLIAITDEYDARSRYDQVVANQIAAQNELNIQLENLRAITGRGYVALSGLGKQLPLVRPQPDNMDLWVTVSTKQNYDLKAQNYSVLAAMQTIKQQAAGGYPSINLQGGVSDSHVVGSPPDTAQDAGNLGLALTYEPIQGGLVIASTEQARYNYVTASGKLEQVHRSVINQTRSSYLSVLSLISKVQADKQNIISASNALDSTKAGLHVGTRTMVDVLRDLTSLYLAQQQYMNDQYDYVSNLIKLKAAAGTLSVDDLKQINTWLDKSIRFPEQLSVASMPTESGNREIKTDDTVGGSSKSKSSDESGRIVEPVWTPATPAPLPSAPVPSTASVQPIAAPDTSKTPSTTQLPSPKSSKPVAILASPQQTMLPVPAST